MPQDRPPPTAEGDLIRRVRQQRTPKLSIPAAAKSVGMSKENWGYIERGHQPTGGGEHRRVVAPADTLARMANAVGVTTDQLREVDRQDAARILQGMLDEQSAPPGRRFTVLSTSDPDPTPESVFGRPLTQPEQIVWALTDIPWRARAAAIRELHQGIADALGVTSEASKAGSQSAEGDAP